MKVLMFQRPGFDYMSSQLTEGFWNLNNSSWSGVEFKTTHANTHHGARVSECSVISTEEAFDSIDLADLIIFSSCGNVTEWDPAEKLLLLDPAYKKKRVFVDGSDTSMYQTDPATQMLYFKREMRIPECNYSIYKNIRSLTFGSYLYHSDKWDDQEDLDAEWERRDIDVSFVAFTGSNPNRSVCADVLNQLQGQKGLNVYCNVSDTGQPLDVEEYNKILCRSKVAISIPGAGVDTLRFWEIPACGAILCSFDITRLLMIRNPYESLRHCLYFAHWQDMGELFADAVFNKDTWKLLRRAADGHRKLHVSTHRAQELLSMVCEVL